MEARSADRDVLRVSSENAGWRVERAPTGELEMTPPTGGASSKRNARLTRLLDEWAERHGFVAFDSSGGFPLPDSSIVSPDGALVTQAAWAALTDRQREGIVRLVPVVAIELAALTDDPRDVQNKMQRVRTAGAAYVAVLDPYRKTTWFDGTPPAGFDLDFGRLLG